jgi:hypothetical protein
MQQPLLIGPSSDAEGTSTYISLMEDDVSYQEVETRLEKFLQEELATYEFIDSEPIAENDLAVKWKYSSAMQKSIRRGYGEDAIKYALVFHSVDPVGFWTRLVVIAFEDIGAGGVWALALTLAAARSRVWRKKVGGDVKVIHYVIKALAESVKDRSACDMMIALWSCTRKTSIFNALKAATLDELSGMVLSERHPTSFRASAAWLLWGTDKLENTKLPRRSGSKELFCSTIEKMKIPALVKYVTLRGMTACRYPMNLVYPFLWSRMEKSNYYSVEKTSFPADRFYIGGLPEECFDQHVREGKRSLVHFSRACSPVDQWLTSKGITSADARVAAIGAAVFIIEGASLDRKLKFEGACEIYDLAERYDYENAGLSLDDGRALAGTIEAGYEILRQSRIRVVEGRGV